MGKAYVWIVESVLCGVADWMDVFRCVLSLWRAS